MNGGAWHNSTRHLPHSTVLSVVGVNDRLIGGLGEKVGQFIGVIAEGGESTHRKEYIRDAQIIDKADKIQVEITHIHDIDFLKGIHQITGFGIAVAVFYNEKLLAVFDVGANLDDLLITAEEGQISIGFRIAYLLEIIACPGEIKGSVIIIRMALAVVIRYMIGEVLTPASLAKACAA